MDAVYQKKIEADAVDDLQGNERQNACEFLYDYMLNAYGLKGLAESAIHGVFRRIKQMMTKGIDKCHKVCTCSKTNVTKGQIFRHSSLAIRSAAIRITHTWLTHNFD